MVILFFELWARRICMTDLIHSLRFSISSAFTDSRTNNFEANSYLCTPTGGDLRRIGQAPNMFDQAWKYLNVLKMCN